MSSPFETTEEERKLIEEIWALEQQINRVKQDRYFLNKEQVAHSRISHTEIVPAVIYTLLCLFNATLLVLDIVIGTGTLSHEAETFLDPDAMLKFALAVALAVGTPLLMVVFGILAVKSYIRLYYQLALTSGAQARAQKKGIENYKRESDRIEISYDIASDRLQLMEQRLKDKKNELDVLQMQRSMAERKAREEQKGQKITYEIVKHEKKVE